MSQGIAVKIARGKVRPERLYIRLKNGAVYKHRETLSPEQQEQTKQALINAKGRVTLRYWERVRAPQL